MATKKADLERDKYQEAANFIKENMKLVSDKDFPRHQLNQEHYVNFLKIRGIQPETVKQMADAVNEFNNASVVVLTELLVDNPKVDRVQISTRTHGGVIKTSLNRMNETRTPVTGEPLTKYGVVGIKMALKSRLDKGLLEECAREVEEASR